jgi:ribokinase
VTKVMIIGSINMDLVARVPRIPSPGETLTGSKFEQIPGGKGANQAVAAVKLTGDAAFIGRVGNDALGRTLVNQLTEQSVTPFVEVSNSSSGVALINVDKAGENSIVIIPGANGLVSPLDVEMYAEQIAASDVVLLQLEIAQETVGAAVKIARRYGIPTVLDTAPVPADGLMDELWDADFLSPNQSEAELLTGKAVLDATDAVAAAEILLSKRPSGGSGAVVMKLGSAGALYWDGQSPPIYQPVPTVTVIDTTAAGDAFSAAFGVRFAETKDPAESLAWGCAAGTLAVQHFGAQPAMPGRTRVAGLALELPPQLRL